MKFFAPNQFSFDPSDTVFRYPVLPDAIALLVFALIGSSCTWFGSSGGINTKFLGSRLMFPPFIAYMMAGTSFFLLLFATISIRKKLSAANWLVCVKNDCLIIKFRSLMNDHFPDSDPVIVMIPFCEINWVRVCKEVRTTWNLKGGKVKTKLNYLELKVKSSVNMSDMRENTHAELIRKAPVKKTGFVKSRTKTQHVPIQIKEPDMIRIEWSVKPGIKKALQLLSFYISIDLPIEVENDFTSLRKLSKTEQETKIVELAESGQTINAIKEARRLYGLDLNEAKRFIADLTGSHENK